MTGPEFLSACADVVGPERGLIRRAARVLGVSVRTLEDIRQGRRPVPAFYVERLAAAAEASDRAGRCFSAAAPRFDALAAELGREGWPRASVLAAAAAWAGLGLSEAP